MSTIDAVTRTCLLSLARETVTTRLHGRQPSETAGENHRCAGAIRGCGAFVTIHISTPGQGRRLRGCIGRMTSSEPLDTLIVTMAASAAFEDPRFRPVTMDELSALDFEISVLTPMAQCGPDDIVPGRHGVYLVKGWASAVFLPQVATEQGWNRQTLLEQLCIKGGMSPSSWEEPGATLYSFEAEVFGELDTIPD